MGFFGFMTAGFALFLLRMFRGDSGVTPGSYWGLIAILSLGALAFVALVLGGRRRWAYLICSATLAVWSARGTYVALWYL
jgi:hypothetical protein